MSQRDAQIRDELEMERPELASYLRDFYLIKHGLPAKNPPSEEWHEAQGAIAAAYERFQVWLQVDLASQPVKVF